MEPPLEPEKVIFVDDILYIRSWKKMDRPKCPTRNHSEYMVSYRWRKQDQTRLLEEKILQLEKSSRMYKTNKRKQVRTWFLF